MLLLSSMVKYWFIYLLWSFLCYFNAYGLVRNRSGYLADSNRRVSAASANLTQVLGSLLNDSTTRYVNGLPLNKHIYLLIINVCMYVCMYVEKG